MRAILQRVSKAGVFIDEKLAGSITQGVVVLLGVKAGDTEKDARWLVDKIVNLRIFENEEGKFHYSLLDIKGEILAISQFTLYGDCRKGRRPSFTDAAEPEYAENIYSKFVELLKKTDLKIRTGQFAAKMRVEIHNDGPVTLTLDSPET